MFHAYDGPRSCLPWLRCSSSRNGRDEAANGGLARGAGSVEKNSSNSSKPPSSDIVKPPKPAAKRGKKRRPGGQPGHAQYERTLSIEQADVIHAHTLDRCPGCADDRRLHLVGAEQTRYPYELVEKPMSCRRISPPSTGVPPVIESRRRPCLRRLARGAWWALD